MVLVGLLGLSGCGYFGATTQSFSIEQQRALRAALLPAENVVMNAFENAQFVGLGDAHYYANYMAAITKLVTSERVVEQASMVVVEFGNQKYQSWVDEYVSGADVDESRLPLVTRETIYFTAWLSDEYVDFFKAVRAYNLVPEHTKKIRVVLAESYFDWAQVQNSEQWRQAAENKVDGFFQQIKPLLNSGEKAVLVFGGFHLLSSKQKEHTLIDKIEHEKPHSTYAIWPMIPEPLAKAFEPTQRGIIATNNTVLRSVDFADILPKAKNTLATMKMQDAKLADMVDAFMYMGPNSRDLSVSDSSRNDAKWMAQMHSRVKLIGGRLQARFESILKG